MPAEFHKAVSQILDNVLFLESKHFPPLRFKKGILDVIKPFAFWERVPVIAVNLYHYSILRKSKITRVLSDAKLCLKREIKRCERLGYSYFGFGWAMAMRHHPCSQTLARAEAEFMEFGRFNPYFLVAPFTSTKLAFPQWVRKTSNSCLMFVAAFPTTKLTALYLAFMHLVQDTAMLASQCDLILFVPRWLTSACILGSQHIYSSLRIGFAFTVERVAARVRTELALAYCNYRGDSLEWFATLQACLTNSVPTHIYIIRQARHYIKNSLTPERLV